MQAVFGSCLDDLILIECIVLVFFATSKSFFERPAEHFSVDSCARRTRVSHAMQFRVWLLRITGGAAEFGLMRIDFRLGVVSATVPSKTVPRDS